jgi:hypothetical protein
MYVLIDDTGRQQTTLPFNFKHLAVWSGWPAVRAEKVLRVSVGHHNVVHVGEGVFKVSSTETNQRCQSGSWHALLTSANASLQAAD